MSKSKIIAINALATYARSFISLFIALFSSRWALLALGDSDFGSYSVITAGVVFITIINTIMSFSAARFYAYHSTESGGGQVRAYFNTALGIHLCLAVVLVVIGLPIGHAIIKSHMVISPDRLGSIVWAFRFCMLSAFFGMIAIPFVSMFAAKQRMAEVAGFGIIQSLLVLLVTYSLTRTQADRLIVYAAFTSLVTSAVQIALIFRANSLFSECRWNYREVLSLERFKNIMSFALWNATGALGAVLRDQGLALLLNVRYGPHANAAYGIANQVSSAVNQFSQATVSAIAPEITASEGSGNRTRMLDLAQKTNKYGSLIVLLIVVPLFFDIVQILHLWLHKPPVYADAFCRLILFVFLVDRLTTGYMIALSAHGRIAWYQITLGGLHILTLPLAWVSLHLGGPPQSIYYVSIVTMALCGIGRILWVSRLLGVSPTLWIKETAIPCSLVALVSALPILALHLIFPASVGRLLCTSLLSFTAGLTGVWLLVLDKDERTRMAGVARNFTARLRPSTP